MSSENSNLQVKDIMTKGVAYMDSTETVEKAAKTMSQYKVGSIIIMENFIAVGIVTERDLKRKQNLPNLPKYTKEYWKRLRL